MGRQEWPSVRSFRGSALSRIKMPVGGIGTGCVSFGGRGQLVDWQLFNRPSMSFQTDSFFAVHVTGNGWSTTRVLEAALTDAELDGGFGSRSPLSGLPRFREGVFSAAYPLGSVTLRDPDVPLAVEIRVFNPLVPGDADASGIPCLVYQATVTNLAAEPVQVEVCGSLQNIVGAHRTGPDRGWHIPSGNTFTFDRLAGADLLLGRGSAPSARDSDGTVALAALGEGSSSVREAWARLSWGDALLDFWDDFSADGQLDQPTDPGRVPTGSLVVSRRLEAGVPSTFTFVIGWHFPHRYPWPSDDVGPAAHSDPEVDVGNHYTQGYQDAAAVVRRVVAELSDLEARTLDFVRSVTDRGLPPVLADAALSNLAVLKTPVCFRIADGTFLGWEGQDDDRGSCHGSCTHVWNYQYAVESLFPELAWTMRRVELVHCLDDRGKMSFRAGLPLERRGTSWPTAAADGQMGALVRLYRTFRAGPDRDALISLWPAARRAMAFAWIPLGWDADQDGVMEGCQHNTMDVEYYGPSGVNQSWYLAALAACAELSDVVGDAEFGSRCRRLLASGAARTDELLFNGDYYQQHVVPPMVADNIAEGLRIRYDADGADEGSDNLVDPDLQIGSGCTTDQLVGHTMARLSGLEVPLDAANVSTALANIYRYNHRADLFGHVNHLRSFALNDEAALLNATFPHGSRPRRASPYCNEVWTGLEYSAAIGLLLDGQTELALDVVADVRDRYDGRRRNPFDEVECGHHYVRSLASWGLVEAWRDQHGGAVGPSVSAGDGQ
jgi:non-lysosomal glucosylceramidase